MSADGCEHLRTAVWLGRQQPLGCSLARNAAARPATQKRIEMAPVRTRAVDQARTRSRVHLGSSSGRMSVKRIQHLHTEEHRIRLVAGHQCHAMNSCRCSK